MDFPTIAKQFSVLKITIIYTYRKRCETKDRKYVLGNGTIKVNTKDIDIEQKTKTRLCYIITVL